MRAIRINNRPAIVIGDTEHMLTESEADDLLIQLSDVVNKPKDSNGSMQEDIDFLLNRAKKAGSCSFTSDRDTGMSSNALVTFAYTGEEPKSWPWDDSDYQACVRASNGLPNHRMTCEVVEMLELMRLKVK